MFRVYSDEQRLRKRIEQLQMYRAHGIRSLAEGEKFDAERKKRVCLYPLMHTILSISMIGLQSDFL
jgi:hypothetical protein